MQVVQRAGGAATLVALVGVLGLFGAGDRGPAQDAGKPATKPPRHILIIRHSEKTGAKEDVHLSSRGVERAQELHQLFVASKDRPDPFPTPDFIFAATHHADSQRPVDTVKPLATKLKLPICDRYDSKLPPAPGKTDAGDKAAPKERMAELAKAIFGSPEYSAKTILVAWRHKTIPDLARTLKAGNVPAKWDEKVFDRVWQITYDDRGSTFRDRPQRLLPGDAER
jgi:hypothetical protein